MRFSELIVGMFFITLFSLFISSELFVCNRLNEKCLELMKKTSCQNFIGESFVNACEGKGFESLNQWQVVCREMFDLDYIGWCDAADFLSVGNNENERLYYGNWNGASGSGEVYCNKDGIL